MSGLLLLSRADVIQLMDFPAYVDAVEAGFDARYMAGGHYGWRAGGKVRLFDGNSPRNGEPRSAT